MHCATIGKLLVAISLTCLLAWQLVSPPREPEPPREPVQPGEPIENLAVARLPQTNGSTSLADLAGAGCAVFYFFDPSCPACGAGRDAWRGYRRSYIGRSDIPLYWISIGSSRDSTMAFIDGLDNGFPVYQVTDKPGIRSAGIGAIPGVWGVAGGIVQSRVTSVSMTSPDDLEADVSWCPEGQAP